MATSTAIYQFLRTKFSGIDWSLGSIIRELIPEPIVRLSAYITADANAAYAKTDIQNLMADPESNTDTINNLYTRLGLTAPSLAGATGTVRILTTSADSFTVGTTTQLFYGDVALAPVGSFTLTAIVTDPSTETPLTMIGADAYVAHIPVTTLKSGISIGPDAQLTWSGLPQEVYEVSVSSAVTGGVAAMTATDKINAIYNYMFPKLVSCQDGINAVLSAGLPNTVIGVKFGQQINNGYSKIYVKTARAPETWSIETTAVKNSDGKMALIIDDSGIIEIRKVKNSTDFVATRGGDRTITITYTPSSGITMETVSVEVFGLKDMAKTQTFLDSYTNGTPFRYYCAVPDIYMLGVYFEYSGNLLGSDDLNKIVNSINATGIDPASIGDTLVAGVIAEAGAVMAGNGLYTTTDIASGAVRSRLSVADVARVFVTDAPYVLYTSLNRIEVTSV